MEMSARYSQHANPNSAGPLGAWHDSLRTRLHPRECYILNESLVNDTWAAARPVALLYTQYEVLYALL